ncbi:hypothetical protein BO86DRAFT_210582 [Aspergillus japonicus CBS 114.51]|uniref:Rhodopsin domain-containing protein n=2 Tax=Aspergillus TaxID=5052 RepID=A0A2V5HNA5_ASPV1|nr:hypothetical protein BO86DRAFT_210582 [Aspergillus japonicus CBS 114.51]PYI23574.1 hypothetical protein BO99DRAFT_181804 [Aspergillus violaceofuscus CBS 115571]RAH84965.1 hypothetical protein BO86DRAFT_210582 [Aspergillus japonicus CBS 114.51]
MADTSLCSPDAKPRLFILNIVFIVLTTLSTTVRIASKSIADHPLWWWDDHFAILSLLSEVPYLSLIILWLKMGLSNHPGLGFPYLFAALFFFNGAICFTKMSAIFFYARVFGVHNRVFRILLWIAGSLVAGWLVSVWISTVFQCRPIARAWNPTLSGTCIELYPWYVSTASLSCLIDLYVLLLPVPLIIRLKTSLRRRLLVLITFFMAYSVVVMSVIRLIVIAQGDPCGSAKLICATMEYAQWAVLESSISVISINVPSGVALAKAILRTPGRMRDSPRMPIDPPRQVHKRVYNGTSCVGLGHEEDLSEGGTEVEDFQGVEINTTICLREIRLPKPIPPT